MSFGGTIKPGQQELFVLQQFVKLLNAFETWGKEKDLD